MYKPKVEFYRRYISSEPWPTDLKIKRTCLSPNGYIRAKFEVDRTKKTEKSTIDDFLILSPWYLDLYRTVLKMNRATVLPSGYTPAKFQRDRSRNNGDIEAESKWERKKENNKNKKLYKNRKVYRLCRSTLKSLLKCSWRAYYAPFSVLGYILF